jgi:hypothetical protein
VTAPMSSAWPAWRNQRRYVAFGFRANGLADLASVDLLPCPKLFSDSLRQARRCMFVASISRHRL